LNLRRIASVALPIGVLAFAAWVGYLAHRVNLEPGGASDARPAGGKASILRSAEGFSYRKVDPLDGGVAWEVHGRAATPEAQGAGWRVEGPRFALYEVEGEAVTPTAIEGARALISLSQVADATLRVEERVRVRRGALEIETEALTAVLPPGRGRDKEARLSTESPVLVRQASPFVEARSAGLAADGALRRLVLAPPVRVLLDPAALEGSDAAPQAERPGGERILLETDSPAVITEPEAGLYEIAFTGPVKGRFDRAPSTPTAEAPPPLEGAAQGGGRLLVRKPRSLVPDGATRTASLPTGTATRVARAPGSEAAGPLGAARTARFHDAVVTEGGSLVMSGRDLSWDGARGVAVLEGDALLRDPGEGSRVLARRIEVRPDALGAGATLTGDVVAMAETPTLTAVVRAERALVAFAPRAGTATSQAASLVPGPLRRITAEGDVTGEMRPVTQTARASPASVTRAARGAADDALASVWHLEADRAEIGFAPAPEGATAPAAPEEGGGGRLALEVGQVALEGVGRQALLWSESTDPATSYRIAGDRITADRARGTATVAAAPGTVSRQRLERGLYRLDAREVRLDERAREARASGEVILVKRAPSNEEALRAESQEALLRFAAPAPSTATASVGGAGLADALGGAAGLRPESFVLSGPGGVRARFVPELLSASSTASAPSDPHAGGSSAGLAKAGAPKAGAAKSAVERSPVLLTATRISGEIGLDEARRPTLTALVAEGSRAAPVVVVPDYETASAERFRLEAEGARYDAASDEVLLLGPAPLLARGDERVTAGRARFRLGALEGILEDGVRGRFYGQVPGDEGDRLLDFSSRSARVLLRRGASGEDAISSLDAEGDLRVFTSDQAVEVTGDALSLRREPAGAFVRLRGSPLAGHWGRMALSSEEIRLPFTRALAPRKADASSRAAPEPKTRLSPPSLGNKER